MVHGADSSQRLRDIPHLRQLQLGNALASGASYSAQGLRELGAVASGWIARSRSATLERGREFGVKEPENSLKLQHFGERFNSLPPFHPFPMENGRPAILYLKLRRYERRPACRPSDPLWEGEL